MSKKTTTGISPTRTEDYSEWYQQIIRSAELADVSPIRGCMVIRPWGYALWENIREKLNHKLEESGHVNAYFPLFIPLSFLEKEAQHIEGFAKECAVVTHHRLEKNQEGKLVPAGELEEPLIIRPTSETIIGASYAKWVQSYRDLPLLINQWANVVRWEMRTRMFLRTTEFLWQEGHTAHETRDEAWEETLKILDVYRSLAEDYMAVPVLTGEKTDAERFPGAMNTFTIEAMLQDRKALQIGTSHFLGQNFSRASNIIFQSRTGKRELAWTTSWGVSTRLIGALIMIHSDDDGLIIPPRLAPRHVVILPVIKNDKDTSQTMLYCDKVASQIREQKYFGKYIKADIDTRDINAGEKGWQWIKKGIPVRIEVGPREVSNKSVYVGRRDHSLKNRNSMPLDSFVSDLPKLLDNIQNSLFQRALSFRKEHTQNIDTWKAFSSFFTPENKTKPEIHGGFAMSYWCGSSHCEIKINETFSVTIRCIPPKHKPQELGPCIVCGKENSGRVSFAKSY